MGWRFSFDDFLKNLKEKYDSLELEISVEEPFDLLYFSSIGRRLKIFSLLFLT